MDLLDGEVEISARDALDAGEKLGIAAIVQVGCRYPLLPIRGRRRAG